MDIWDCEDKSMMKYIWGCLRMAHPFFPFWYCFETYQTHIFEWRLSNLHLGMSQNQVPLFSVNIVYFQGEKEHLILRHTHLFSAPNTHLKGDTKEFWCYQPISMAWLCLIHPPTHGVVDTNPDGLDLELAVVGHSSASLWFPPSLTGRPNGFRWWMIVGYGGADIEEIKLEINVCLISSTWWINMEDPYPESPIPQPESIARYFCQLAVWCWYTLYSHPTKLGIL